MEIDPFIFRFSIFILSIRWILCCMERYPSLHTPLMSVTNAISSVIIVGAIIAALAGSSSSTLNIKYIRISCNPIGCNKHFWWIFSYSKNATNVQKEEKIIMSANFQQHFI